MSIHVLINQILTHSLTVEDKINVTVNRKTGNYQLNFSGCNIEFRLLNGIDQEKLFLNKINGIEAHAVLYPKFRFITSREIDRYEFH